MAKKRFGVSIDSKISAELDSIARNLNTDRSKIVEIALQSYITEHKHLSSKHNCRGILIMKGIGGASFNDVLESYRSVIVNHIHSHIENECVHIVFVSGDSEHINSLNKYLIACGCFTRYLPLH